MSRESRSARDRKAFARVFYDEAARWDAPVPERINLPALRSALETLRAHRDLITASGRDILGYSELTEKIAEPGEITSHDAVALTLSALVHVLEDDYRSEETKGGS